MGAASSFKRRIEDQSCGITALPGVDDLGDLTPFQNQVLDFAEKKEQKEKEKQREEARNGNSPQRNARSPGRGGQAQSSDMGREETVRYVNKELNPDHEVHESD
jgi:hypothetical protein